MPTSPSPSSSLSQTTPENTILVVFNRIPRLSQEAFTMSSTESKNQSTTQEPRTKNQATKQKQNQTEKPKNRKTKTEAPLLLRLRSAHVVGRSLLVFLESGVLREWRWPALADTRQEPPHTNQAHQGKRPEPRAEPTLTHHAPGRRPQRAPPRRRLGSPRRRTKRSKNR